MVDETTQPTDKLKALNLVESAAVQADRLARENERMEKNIKQLQELEAISKLGGRTVRRCAAQSARYQSPL